MWSSEHKPSLGTQRVDLAPDGLHKQRHFQDPLSEAEVRRAYLAARRAGPLRDPPEPLSLDELNAPIDPDAVAPEQSFNLPAIEGYLMLAELSAGGQAVVYKAVQESTRRKVAVKVLPGGNLTGRRSRMRFEREAEILASLDHPNIIGIVDRGRTSDGSFFLVMQYVDGWALDDYLGEVGRDVQKTLPLLARIADAVGEAHRHGVVHRDIKPSNIIVDGRGEPHILDFGLARLTEEDFDDDRGQLTRTGQILGSLPWLSPEQARGAASRLDARSDVYALGVLFYQALTGEFPYPIDGGAQLLFERIATFRPPPPGEKVPGGLSPGVDEVVLRALAKVPAQRYATAAELAADLRLLLAGRRPLPPRHALASWRWRRLWGEGMVLVLTLALVFTQAGIRSARKVARNGPVEASLSPLLGATERPPPTDERLATERVSREVTVPTTRPTVLKNTIGMRFVRIEPGEFRMGSPEDESNRVDDEVLHPVVISRPFWISETELTQAQYRRVTGRAEWNQRNNDPDLPADGINYEKALLFCCELSRMDGRTYRLPTEAEWEYCCRAGTITAYANDAAFDDMAWHQLNSGGRLRRVATKRPNNWGIYDMHGNAAEWCVDGYAPYPQGRVVDPVWRGVFIQRVLRGGSAVSGLQYCRSAARGARDPEVAYEAGIRVVLVEPERIASNPN